MCYHSDMENISQERYDAAVALYKSWEESDIYKQKFEGAASIIATLLAYLSDTYDLGIESIPEETFKAEAWLESRDDDLATRVREYREAHARWARASEAEEMALDAYDAAVAERRDSREAAKLAEMKLLLAARSAGNEDSQV